jgi:hypothetical protein
MKKLALLLSLIVTTALLACLQAKPSPHGTNTISLEKETACTQQLDVATSEKRGSSGVTVIIWP